MRLILVLVHAALIVGAPVSAQEDLHTVNGFHGHPWGTERSEIPEVASSEPVPGLDMVGAAYATEIQLLGLGGLAVFVFDEESENGLVQGMYSLESQIRSCSRDWDRIEGAIGDAYPDLNIETFRPEMGEADRMVFDNECEYFVYNDDEATWATRFVNILTGNMEVGMGMASVSLSPTIQVFYRSARSIELDEETDERDESLLGPVNP